MPKTRVNCPNCRQPVVAEVNQLFDNGVDPKAKQLLLSGAYNLIQCPTCGYQGNLATPLVYHDPDKELLLTYFPAELGLPVNEQERIIGPLVTQAMNSLPQEKRKAYLLRPQTMLTMQSLIERILEGDGITKEMIQEQQKRLALLQRMLDVSDDVLAEMAKADDKLIDNDFFQLISRLAEAAMMGGDRESAVRLNELQKKLIPLTTFGLAIQEQSKEVEAAMQSLRDLGENLTQEKLLNLFIAAPTELRLNVLVSMTRQGLDYSFFQMLTEKIDASQGEQRQKLIALREHVLNLTKQIDEEMAKRVAQARQVVDALSKAPDVAAATKENLGLVDDFFLRAMNEGMENARKAGDLEKIGKLQQIAQVIQDSSAPPEEYALIEELVNLDDPAELKTKLEMNKDKINEAFLEAVAALMSQAEEGEENQDFKTKLEELYNQALRMSMRQNMQ
jgi:hypothetical protein